MGKWFGKLVYSREGIVDYHEFETEAEAKAYVKGIADCKDQTSAEDDDQLEDFFGHADQIEPVDE